jgi:glucose-6-phosphate isomerase
MALLVDSKLKRLNLDDITGIGDGATEHLAKITSLEFLHLGKTGVTDEGLENLETLVNLTEINLNNTALTKKAVDALQAKLPKLKKVTF